MMEITEEIRAWIKRNAGTTKLDADEYIDASDGLIHCKNCKGSRQTIVPNFGKPGYLMPRCICACQIEAERRRKEADAQRERMERIKRRKAQGLQDRYLGTGKSFFAGCIANALLERDVPVLMTNFPSILNRLTGVFSEDRADFIASLELYDLLIIDDLGVERSTEYAMEQMFYVIDSRYRSRKPMIITTNLRLEEIKNPPDLAHARIYDRILERCAPILFAGKNFREENAAATRTAAKQIVSPEERSLAEYEH